MFNVIPFYLSKLIKYKIKSRFEIKERKKKISSKRVLLFEYPKCNVKNLTFRSLFLIQF